MRRLLNWKETLIHVSRSIESDMCVDFIDASFLNMKPRQEEQHDILR